MSEEKTYTEAQAHKHFGVKFNNTVWELLDKPSRTEEEDHEMLHAAHASLLHWSKVGTQVNRQRGEWMLARVHTVLKNADLALRHARRCLALTNGDTIQDFDVYFAREAVARAGALAGNRGEFETYARLAAEALEKIKDPEDKAISVKDFQTGPWFGMK